jgi:hypothetical protein
VQKELYRTASNQLPVGAIDNSRFHGVRTTIQVFETDLTGFGRLTLWLAIKIVPVAVARNAIQFRLHDHIDRYSTGIVT